MSPPILSKPSKAATLAIAFVTIGALIMVSCTVWYVWMVNHQPADAGGTHSDAPFYWCALFFFNGLTVFVIGLAIGRIGRSARRAELPPEVSPNQPTAQPAVASPILQPTAANGQAVYPGQPVAAVPPVAPTAPTAQVR
jgi:hypothetical protein